MLIDTTCRGFDRPVWRHHETAISTRFELLRSWRLHVAGEVAVWILQRQRLASKSNAGLGDLAGLSLPTGCPMKARGASASSLLVVFAIDTSIHKPANDPGQCVFDWWQFRGDAKPGAQLLPIVEPRVVIPITLLRVERQTTQHECIEAVAQ